MIYMSALKTMVREVKNDDYEAILTMINQLMGGLKYDKKVYKKVWKSCLKSDYYKGFVAIANGEIIGYIDVIFYHDIGHGGKLGQIQNLVVSEEYRKRGVGKLLIRSVIEFARKEKFLELHVSTRFENEEAIRLYEKMGFKSRSLLLEMEF